MSYPSTTAHSSAVIPFPTEAGTATSPERDREAARHFLCLLDADAKGFTFQVFVEKEKTQ